MAGMTIRDHCSTAFVLVDDDDFEWLNRHSWHVDGGYARRMARKEGGHVYMHRQIMGLSRHDGKQIDHVNRNRLDNRRSNLRIATWSEQQLNRDMPVGSSGVRGVTWHKQTGLWRVKRKSNGVETYYGGFRLFDDAVTKAQEVWANG